MANASDEFRLASSGIDHEGRLPRKYTSQGQGAKSDISPPLEWYNVPNGTKTLALVVEDVDAPDPDNPLVPWTVWVVINIPPNLKGLPEGFSGKEDETGGDYARIKEGHNDFKVPGWRCPTMPSSGHRFEFKLYALDDEIDLGNKFEGIDFRRWQKKMHFFLTSMSVVYVLSTPCPKDVGDYATLEKIRKRSKWENDDYIARGLILNGMSDSFFDIYLNHESAKELWDSLETKYMSEDASSKKFLVSNFNNYKMVDSRPVMEQYNELIRILGQFTQHKMHMDETIQVSSVIDKLPPSWKEFKHSLKHKKEELTLIELGSHLRIEESLRAQDNDKPKSNDVAGTSSVNMVEHKKSTNDKNGKRKHHEDNKANPNMKSKLTCWKCGKSGHLKRDCRVNVGNKNTNGSGTSGTGNGCNNQNP